MRVYSNFARVLRAIYRATHPRWRVETMPYENEAVVYIVHHQNMFGPVHAIGLLPVEPHMWSLHVFCDRDTCFDQFYTFTFSQRFGWPKPLAFALAKALSYIVPALFKSLRVIPVYHDMQSVITMRQSLACLLRGESLIIYPDVEYSSSDSAMGAMYTGFSVLGQMYHKQSGQPLRFIPLYCSRNQRRIVAGEPVVMEASQGRQAGAALVNELAARINALGVQCGDITPSVDEKCG